MLGRHPYTLLILMTTVALALLFCWSPSSSMHFRRFVVVAFGYESGADCPHHHCSPLSVVHHTPSGSYDVTLHVHRMAAERPTANMPNITLVSHATIDRLPHVARWCRTLRGPMSISVFVRPVVDDVAAVMGAFAADECIARHADLHLVTERGHTFNASAASGADGKDMMTHYPFNVQRNAALDGCVGALALLMDIDFHLMPMPNNREVDLRRHLEAQRAKVAAWPFLADEPWVMDAALYVIPAVETMNKEVPLPRTLSELRTGVETHSVLAFYHTCQTCHRPTDLRKFLRHPSDPYLVQFEEGYEPYVIVNRSSTTPYAPHREVVPRYDEVFVGRGWDKMSFFYELAVGQRRPFVVLPHYFLTHHGKGDMPKFLTTEYMRRQEVNRALMGRFKEDMAEKYGTVAPSRSSGGGGHLQKQDGEGDAARLRSSSMSSADDDEQVLVSGGAPSSCGPGASMDCPSPGGSIIASSDAANNGPAVVVQDELLWRATEGIDWGLVGTTLGFPVSCLCRIRNDADVAPGDAAALADIVAKACEAGHDGVVGGDGTGLNCAAVQPPGGVRSVPGSILRRADWVFDRSFHHALSRGADVAEACAFGGYGVLIGVPSASQDGGHAADGTDDNEEDFDDPVSFGCTYNRDACVPLADVHRLLKTICSDGADTGGGDTGGSDRVGGGCEPLFERMHPLVRRDARMQLAVALNAHHAVYHGLPRRLPPTRVSGEDGGAMVTPERGDFYATCQRRWGKAAAFVKRPENVQWARPQ